MNDEICKLDRVIRFKKMKTKEELSDMTFLQLMVMFMPRAMSRAMSKSASRSDKCLQEVVSQCLDMLEENKGLSKQIQGYLRLHIGMEAAQA